MIPPKTYFHDHSLSYHRLSSPMTTLENTEGATKWTIERIWQHKPYKRKKNNTKTQHRIRIR